MRHNFQKKIKQISLIHLTLLKTNTKFLNIGTIKQPIKPFFCTSSTNSINTESIVYYLLWKCWLLFSCNMYWDKIQHTKNKILFFEFHDLKFIPKYDCIHYDFFIQFTYFQVGMVLCARVRQYLFYAELIISLKMQGNSNFKVENEPNLFGLN